MLSQAQEIITRDTLPVSPNFTFVREGDPHYGASVYGVAHEGERVGRAELSERIGGREVGFDIYIATAHRRQKLGITALQALASLLSEEGLDLVTAGVDGGARPYWVKQAAQGLVVPLDPTSVWTTNYRVLPAVNG